MNLEPIYPKYESYLKDESGLTGEADEIAFPQDTEALAAIMKAAAEDGRPLTLQGSRTGLAGGAVPEGGLVVSLSRMDGILGFEKQEDKNLLHVEAGATLEAIDRDAAPRRLSFMPNPTEESATAGGMFAAGSCGLNGLRYGAGHRHVEALRWVSPGGEIWKIDRGAYIFDGSGCALPGGGRLRCEEKWFSLPAAARLPRKGQDLIDFLAGSAGKYGAAAELWLNLLPRPEDCWGLLFFFTDDDTLAHFAGALLHWHKTPPGRQLSAAEYYDRAALALLAGARERSSHLQRLPPLPAHRAAVYLELSGNEPEALERALLECYAHFCDAGGDEDETWAVNSSAEVQRLQQLRHSLTELFNSGAAAITRERKMPPGRLESDFTGPPEKLAQYMDLYRSDLARAGVTGYLYGHLLQNNLHAALLPQDLAAWEQSQALIRQWGKKVLQDNGLLISEHGEGRLKEGLLQNLLPPEALRAKRNLEDLFTVL